MKITIEVVLDEKDFPMYALRVASLMGLMTQALRDEAYGRGNRVSDVGLGVTVGSESLLITRIENDSERHQR